MQPTFEQLFQHPLFFIQLCSEDFSIFSSCLGLSKSIRRKLLEYENTFKKVYPNWQLKLLLPNIKALVMNGKFDGSGWFVLNKQLVPQFTTLREFADIQSPSQVTTKMYTEMGVVDYLTDEDHVGKFSHNLGKFWFTKILDFDNRVVADYYFIFENGDILIQAEVIQEFPDLHECQSWGIFQISRNLTKFLSDMFFIHCLDNLNEDTITENVLDFRDELVALLPRRPEFKYDFCQICHGGRYTGQKYECFGCMTCANFTICDHCFQHEYIDNPTHPHELRDVQDYHEEQEGRELEPTKNFCDGCNNYIWEDEIGLAFVCQHTKSPIPSRKYCRSCVNQGKAIGSHKNCRFELDHCLSIFFCNACGQYFRFGEEFKSCKTCFLNPDATYDMCIDCEKTTPNTHSHGSIGNWVTNWVTTHGCPSFTPCDVCERDISRHDIRVYCRDCFGYFCELCAATHDFGHPDNQFMEQFGRKIN